MSFVCASEMPREFHDYTVYGSQRVGHNWVTFIPLHCDDMEPTRLLCPWDSPGKNTGVGCHSLLQRIFPTQGSNPHVLSLVHYHWHHLGNTHKHRHTHVTHTHIHTYMHTYISPALKPPLTHSRMLLYFDFIIIIHKSGKFSQGTQCSLPPFFGGVLSLFLILPFIPCPTFFLPSLGLVFRTK